VISALAMERAIALAQGSGIGFVGVRNSNFFGAGAYYVNQAASTGMIGVATSNSVPHVAAFGGRAPVLGTNPFAFGAPRSDGRNVLLDMSTSGSAGSMILKAIERNEPLPEGVAIDGEGRPITDPSKVEQGALLPFGGAKGYGLAVMVEILSGVLTGAGIADGVKSMFKNFQEGGNNGHFFVAVDIGRLMPLSLWYERLDYLINALKASGAGDDEVRYPGESRWEAYADNVKNGIGLDAPTLKALTSLGKEYRIDAPWLRT
jgi:LDH2 family malate/lactate/ureidoglycolate dehydrogenase